MASRHRRGVAWRRVASRRRGVASTRRVVVWRALVVVRGASAWRRRVAWRIVASRRVACVAWLVASLRGRVVSRRHSSVGSMVVASV
ncbi:hypothetical protein ACXZ9C_11270 [Streptococcus agalactiae]